MYWVYFIKKVFFDIKWLGGVVFGLMGKRINKYGRDFIVFFGYLVYMVVFFLIFMNIFNGFFYDSNDFVIYMIFR